MEAQVRKLLLFWMIFVFIIYFCVCFASYRLGYSHGYEKATKQRALNEPDTKP